MAIENMKKSLILIYFVCLMIVLELYNFFMAPHISNLLVNIILSAVCGGVTTFLVYELMKK